MKNVLKKELLLALHPTAPLFLLLSAMLIIPNYPYYVVFFYNALAIFFTCLLGRENNDVFYSLTLPIPKRDIVKGRFAFVVLLQVAQLVIAVPFALLRQQMPLPGNQVGMDANIALFGLSLILMGLFNLVFFAIYYKDINKVGTAFAWGSAVVFVYICIAEAAAHVVPFFRDVLDTKDPQNLSAKLLVLAIGGLLYAAFTLLAYRRAVQTFEVQDL